MEKKVLISGGGIAGLSLGILLKEQGWDPLIIEKTPRMRTEGYMMDFFGSGWDTAKKMGLLDDIKKIHYPIDYLEFVDKDGLKDSPRSPSTGFVTPSKIVIPFCADPTSKGFFMIEPSKRT